MNPLSADWRSNSKLRDGRSARKIAEKVIKPNSRLTSFERIELYNRQYWFRLLDILYDDFPGVRAILGEDKFLKLRFDYLAKHPSTTYTLRDLGENLPAFIQRRPNWGGSKRRLLLDMVRFEWAQIVAFDAAVWPTIKSEVFAKSDARKLKLALQPYITLLELHYPLDEFSLALRKELLKQTSEASSERKRQRAARKRIKLPRSERVFLAVHRVDNALYYKRLEPPAYSLLCALRDGSSLASACEIANRAFPKRLQSSEQALRSIQAWFSNFSALNWFCVPPKG